MQLAALAITGLFGAQGLRWWDAWRESRKERVQHDDKVVERRSSRMDAELERVLKLKDDRIEDMKATLSERNTENKRLLAEVATCYTEKALFAETSGKQAVQIVELKAEAAHAKADVADLEKDIAGLRQELIARNARINQLETSQAGVREAVTKLDAVAPVSP